MIKFLRNIFLLLFISCSAFSQEMSDKFQSIRLDAEYYFFNGNYERALLLFKDILKEDPDNCNVNYKVGICLQNMQLVAGRPIK